MTSLLIKLFVRDRENTGSERVRMNYARTASITGLSCNILLAALKLLIGTISGSVSVSADGLNNLSDTATSVIMLLGFRMSAKKPDKEHPFGHGRIEYITGLIIAFAVLLMGVELFKSSVGAIKSGKSPEYSDIALMILALSAALKLWMSFFYRRIGRIISSKPLFASSADSISDCFSTTAVLAGALISRFAGINTDGWLGCAVSFFILYSGIRAAIETIQPLLGDTPDPELVSAIERIMRSDPMVLDLHDLIVHDYGPGRRIVSVHAEVPAERSVTEIHDVIDALENRIQSELGCEISVHMDPVDRSDPEYENAKILVRQALDDVDPRLLFHDLQVIRKAGATVLLFDVAVPDGAPKNAGQTEREISEAVSRRAHDTVALAKLEAKYK